MLPILLSVKEQAGSSRQLLANFQRKMSHKGVLFDEIDTNCGIVNSVSIYLT